MKKSLFAVIMALVLCLVPVIGASAASDGKVHLVDNAGVLTDSAAASIEGRLQTVGNELGIGLAVMTIESLDDGAGDSEAAAKQVIKKYCDATFGDDYVGLIFMVDTRDLVVSGKGLPEKASTLTALSDAAFNNIAGDNYEGAINAFIDEASRSCKVNGYTYAEWNSFSKIQRAIKSFRWGLNAIIAAVIGLLGGAITGSALKSELKSVHSNDSAAHYIKDGSFKLSHQRDVFLYKEVVRTAKQATEAKVEKDGTNTTVSRKY